MLDRGKVIVCFVTVIVPCVTFVKLPPLYSALRVLLIL